ncbi:S-layer homology domain-containing protein [Paenibacillus silvestris]|nr:S-layer homology domain-containing protein [Paenibacillus silvestris]
MHSRTYKRLLNKRISIVLLAILLVLSSALLPEIKSKAYAEASPSSTTLQKPIREWIMDEAKGYIYAVSSEANSLLFIRMSDLQIEKQVTLTAPSDLVQSGGKLYVALSGTTAIAIVDIARKEVTGSITTSIKPYDLAIDGDKLFYAELHSWSSVAAYNLTTQTETVLNGAINGEFSDPDLAIDTANHILFVGESGSSGSNLYSYSSSTLQPLSRTTYDKNYGFGYPDRKVIVDGNQVFYAGYRFKNTDLASIQGTYQDDAMYVKGNAVFTSHAFNSGNAAPDHSYVYDREGFTQIAELPVASRKILMDSKNHIYSYTGSDAWSSNIPNVIQIINVNLVPSTPPISWQTVGQKLTLDKSVTDLVYSNDGESLFAISSASNQLMRIRASDMTVQETRTIGSNPNSIFIDHDELYISNASATQILRVDTLGGTSVNGTVFSWDVGSFVSQVVYGNQKLIYTASNMSVFGYPGIQVLDTATGTKANYAENLNQGRMVLSLDDNALYFGEKPKYSTSTAFKFNLTNFSQQAVSQVYSNAVGEITMSGNDLYYASNLLNKNTLVQIPAWKSYFGAAIIAAKGANVFAQDTVWDRDSYTMQYHLPFIAKNVLTLPSGQIVMLSEDGKTIQKFNSMQALHDSAPEFNPPALQVYDVYFNDNDATAGEISGNISWYTPLSTLVTSYTVYFLDQNKNKIGNKVAEIPYTVSNYYNNSLPETSIPSGAMYLGVYAKNAIGESSSAATSAFWDYVSPPTGGGGGGSYYEYTFEDQEPTRGRIHPLVKWITAIETYYTGYQLSFTDASGKMLGNPYSVPKHETPSLTYQVDIAENVVPVGAIYIDLRPKELSGAISKELYRMQIFDNTTSSPIIVGTNSTIPAPNLGIISYLDNDNDLSRGNFGGSISWSDFSSDGVATSYDLYFVDRNNAKLQSIAEVTKNKLIRPGQWSDNPTYEITFSKGTTIPAGTERIGVFGKNNQGEGTNGYYFGFWDSIDYDPGSYYFEDQDTHIKNVKGVLHWVPKVDESSIKEYVVRFIDSRMEAIGSPFAQISKGQQQYNVSIQDTQIPADALSLRLSAVNSANDEIILATYNLVNNIADEPVSTLPTDNQLPVESIYQLDSDGDVGEVGGLLNFSANSSLNTLHYEVYFVNDQLKMLKPIVSVPVNSNRYYQTNIPMNTQIPLGATKIAVYAVSATGISPARTTSLYDWHYGRSLTPNQIQITNNKSGTADTITVSSLSPGDIVRVYRNSNSANSFLRQVIAGNETSVNFSIPQLGTEAGSLYFSVQQAVNIPSLKIEKTYNAEPVPSGGGGGGGGGSGGSKSLPKPDANGKMTYDVQPAHIDMLIDLSNSAKSQLVLDATTDQHIDITTVSFDADIVKIAADKGKPIVVKTNDVQLTFPVNALVVKDMSNIMELKIWSGEFSALSNFHTVSPLVEFTLTEQDKAITDFNSPVEVVFHYDPSKVKDTSKLGVYWLDKATNTWTYVGGTVNGDGTITASLPHFSKYAVLEKNAQSLTTFADIQGHWAQADIEQLVSKQIVDGMDANSFQPNSNMTRAQFVTILKKAMNLPVQTATKSFADVADDSWYRDAVFAAYAANITGGTSDSTFAPEDNVTREQLAVMIVGAYLNATGKQLSDLAAAESLNYADASSISDWAKQYVAVATSLGLLNGMDVTHFAPSQNSTRAQVATVVVRMLKQISGVK